MALLDRISDWDDAGLSSSLPFSVSLPSPLLLLLSSPLCSSGSCITASLSCAASSARPCSLDEGSVVAGRLLTPEASAVDVLDADLTCCAHAALPCRFMPMDTGDAAPRLLAGTMAAI